MALRKIFYLAVSSLLSSLMIAINFYIAGLVLVDFYGKSSNGYILNTSFVLAFLSFLVVIFFLYGTNRAEGNLIPFPFYFLHVLNIFFIWIILFSVAYSYIVDNLLLFYALSPVWLLLLIFYFVISSYLKRNTVGIFYYGKAFFKLLFFIIMSSLILASAIYVVVGGKIVHSCDKNLDTISKQECEYRAVLANRGYKDCLELRGEDEKGLTYRDKCLNEKAMKYGDSSLCRLILNDSLLEKCLNVASEEKSEAIDDISE